MIYISQPGKIEPPIGDYLGELTNELPPDRYIEMFIGGGAKNYSFRLDNGDESCRIRGFTLNYKNSKVINFDAIKDMVLYGKEGATLVNPHKITRDIRKRKVYNRVETKKYSLVYTKRVVLPDLTTIPYGY